MVTYDNSFDPIMDPNTDGGITQFMDKAGLWVGNKPQPRVTVAKLAGNKTHFDNLRGLNSIVLGDLWEVIGSTVTTNCKTSPRQCVVAKSDSSLLALYQAIFDKFLLNLGSPEPGTNFVPDYVSYNSTVVAYYLKSLTALQAGFMMEWLVNQYNFNAAGCADSSTCLSTQLGAATGVCIGTDVTRTYKTATNKCFYGSMPIPSLGKIAGTLYPPELPTDLSTPQAAVTAYNEAQKQLALLYGARVNQLYLNALNWIFSDGPSSPQAYPEGGRFITSANCEDTNYINSEQTPVQRCVDFNDWTNKIQFAVEVGKSLTSVSGAPSTPLQQVAGTAGTEVVPGWMSDLVLYQFPIQNVYKCAATLKAYNAGKEAAGAEGSLEEAFADPLACPPIFSLSDGGPLDGGYYDGDTLQAYFWVEPEDTDFDLSSSSCPEICFTTPAAPIVYTCGGVVADPNVATGSPRSVCQPGPEACPISGKPYPKTCLPSPNGALSLAQDIPSDWNTAGADNGGWGDSGFCNDGDDREDDDNLYYIPLGPAWETCSLVTPEFGGFADGQCGSCPNDAGMMVSSCKVCDTGHWKNSDGTLECAPGNPQTPPVFTGVPNSFDNPPTLTTFCYPPPGIFPCYLDHCELCKCAVGVQCRHRATRMWCRSGVGVPLSRLCW